VNEIQGMNGVNDVVGVLITTRTVDGDPFMVMGIEKDMLDMK
jgi:hypothetical protein